MMSGAAKKWRNKINETCRHAHVSKPLKLPHTFTWVLVTANNLHYAIHFFHSIVCRILSRLCVVLACSQHERTPITVFPFSTQNYTIHNRIMANTKRNWFCLHLVACPIQFMELWHLKRNILDTHMFSVLDTCSDLPVYINFVLLGIENPNLASN